MPPKKQPVTWWQGAVLTVAISAVSWLTLTIVNLNRTSDNGPLMREARDRNDARHDQDVRDQINDLRARLISVEARCR